MMDHCSEQIEAIYYQSTWSLSLVLVRRSIFKISQSPFSRLILLHILI